MIRLVAPHARMGSSAIAEVYCTSIARPGYCMIVWFSIKISRLQMSALVINSASKCQLRWHYPLTCAQRNTLHRCRRAHHAAATDAGIPQLWCSMQYNSIYNYIFIALLHVMWFHGICTYNERCRKTVHR